METPGNTAEQNQTSETGEVKLNTTRTRQANIRINNAEVTTLSLGPRHVNFTQGQEINKHGDMTDFEDKK